jgi:hypothetical protein
MWKGDVSRIISSFPTVLWLGLYGFARSSSIGWVFSRGSTTPRRRAEQSVPGDNSKQQRPREHLDFGSKEADSEAIHTKSSRILKQKWGFNKMTKKNDKYVFSANGGYELALNSGFYKKSYK